MKTDDAQEGRGIRIYTKPNVKPIPALWTLIGEGELDITENSLELYSFNQLFEELIKQS